MSAVFLGEATFQIMLAQCFDGNLENWQKWIDLSQHLVALDGSRNNGTAMLRRCVP